MILDERTEFCDVTALNTGAAGTYVIGDQVDLGVARDLGGDQAATLRISVATTATSGGAATGAFQLVSADNAALTTNPVVHFQSDAIPVASLVAGTVVADVQVPRANYKRYIGIRQVTGTAAFTAGAIDANLAFDTSGWRAYADAVN
jgi:hypothetical protein